MRSTILTDMRVISLVGGKMVEAKDKIIIWHEMDTLGDLSLRHVEVVCKELKQDVGVGVDLIQKTFVDFIIGLQNLEEIEDKPDIVLIAQDMVNMETAKLSDVPEEFGNGMEKGVWDSMKYKGVQKGIPYLQGNHALLFYNQQYFQEKPTTWEQICDISIEDVTPIAIDLEEKYWILPFLYTFSNNHKGKIDKVGEETTVRCIREYLQSKKLISENANGSMLTRFLKGEIAAIINGEWKYQFLHEEMGENLGVAMLPSIESIHMIGTSGTFGMAFPNHSLGGAKKDLIYEFINKMSSDKVQQQWYQEYHRLPINQKMIEHMIQVGERSDMYDVYRQMKANVNLVNEECMGEYWERCERIQKKCLA